MDAKRSRGERLTFWGRTANAFSLVGVAVVVGIVTMVRATHSLNDYAPIQFVNYANAYGLAFIAAVLTATRGIAGYLTWFVFSNAKNEKDEVKRRRSRIYALIAEVIILGVGFAVATVGSITTKDSAPWIAGAVLVAGLLAQDVCAAVGAEWDEREARLIAAPTGPSTAPPTHDERENSDLGMDDQLVRRDADLELKDQAVTQDAHLGQPHQPSPATGAEAQSVSTPPAQTRQE